MVTVGSIHLQCTRSWNFHNLAAEQYLPGQAVRPAVRTANNSQAGQDCGSPVQEKSGQENINSDVGVYKYTKQDNEDLVQCCRVSEVFRKNKIGGCYHPR